ncbi:hypothetical protein KIN20_013798 [Parelaphostrongylus tenuis]|uniref:Uncharacterized protein n=1 Tax=Parelaphostrongylus tenuis TaxID=148309 RepID=A0AAD5QRA4_PARTN|nr:hypothetical protein KIN20_013798 [Parelaphostrongylus tenuis]
MNRTDDRDRDGVQFGQGDGATLLLVRWIYHVASVVNFVLVLIWSDFSSTFGGVLDNGEAAFTPTRKV